MKNFLFTSDDSNKKAEEHILDPAGAIVASKRFDGAYDNMYFFYNYDFRGSVTNIINPEGKVVKGYDYDEFGNTKETDSTKNNGFKNDVKFTGAVHDMSSGLYYMNARFYNPNTGRFLSQDSYSGNAYEPWTQHLYSYCGNNPINFIDPTGHKRVAAYDDGGGIDYKGFADSYQSPTSNSNTYISQDNGNHKRVEEKDPITKTIYQTASSGYEDTGELINRMYKYAEGERIHLVETKTKGWSYQYSNATKAGKCAQRLSRSKGGEIASAVLNKSGTALKRAKGLGKALFGKAVGALGKNLITSAAFSAGFSLLDGNRGATVYRDAAAGLITGLIAGAATAAIIAIGCATGGAAFFALPAVAAGTGLIVGGLTDRLIGNSVKNFISPAFGCERVVYK